MVREDSATVALPPLCASPLLSTFRAPRLLSRCGHVEQANPLAHDNTASQASQFAIEQLRG
jgi:hypothetical protein